jgi:hypothetical protein
MTKPTQLKYTRPYLYPKQLAAIFDERRYSIIEASSKSGKTSGCIVWLGEKAFAGRAGQNFWWVAPVNAQTDIAFRRMVRSLPRQLIETNITLKTVTLINGAVIWFKSADNPDSLYGEDVYAAVVDEASRMKEDSWYAVRTTLTATRGAVRIIGNVKGRRTWFYQIARRAEAGEPDMGYHKIIAADAIEAKVLDAGEIEDARRLLPENVFRELYLAEASDDEGNPFGLKAIAACIGELSDRGVAWWGWDLAKSTDWTVGIGLDREGRTARFIRFQLPWEETTRRILSEVGEEPALIDSTGVGDPIVERLARSNRKIEGYKFSAPSKQKLMEGLAVAIQGGEISYPDGVIVMELNSFEYEIKRSSVSYSAPEGMHDDCVMALALAQMCRSNHAGSYDSSLDWVGDWEDLKVKDRDTPPIGPLRRWDLGHVG